MPVPFYRHNRPELLASGDEEIQEAGVGQASYEARAATPSYEDISGPPQTHISFEGFGSDNFNFDSCFDFDWDVNVNS